MFCFFHKGYTRELTSDLIVAIMRRSSFENMLRSQFAGLSFEFRFVGEDIYQLNIDNLQSLHLKILKTKHMSFRQPTFPRFTFSDKPCCKLFVFFLVEKQTLN